eukprot:TRINITY_DN16115_c0_g1_i1.p1 TRINITY_DN16115_c0_g1~~TRINITY_DN16115_c0_g1_i1.p1  ORF type:complete len:251 (+),score=51.10 TRINITY_DN16115_c0_g1_i1:48-800(+)
MGKDRKMMWNSASRKQVAIATEKDAKGYSKMLSAETVAGAKLKRNIKLTKVIIVSEDSFKASEKYANAVVLDFASDSNAGGGWRGGQTGTQEESLCRRSTLGISLEKHSASGGYPIDTNNCIYVKNVTVFREPEELDYQSITPFETSVIAASLRSSDSIKQITSSTDSVIFTAINKGHDTVVLGAWGCGAFGNSPSAVATAFAASLKKADTGTTPFTAVFAIPPNKDGTADKFGAVLSKAFPDIIEISTK